MNKSLFYIALFTIATLVGCNTTTKLTNQNVHYIYNTEASMLHPEFQVMHVNDSLSRLYFKVNSSELLYTKKNEDTTFTATFAVSFVLYESYESNVVLDSASMLVKDSPLPGGGKEIISYIDFESGRRKETLLQAKVTDVNRNQSAKAYLKVTNTSPNSKQNFTLIKSGQTYPAFNTFVNSDERFAVHHWNKKHNTFNVRFYGANHELALPPFSVIDPEPLRYGADSLFTIQAGKEYTFSKPGMYHIQVDTMDKMGLTIFRYENDFPEIRYPEQLLFPLRYLTSKQEYAKMEKADKLKNAIDDFWIDIAGNPSRAKELIKKYYGRVEDANRFFTSYLEGWKSDRGMIYLVYGPPNIIYKNSNSETWVYGEENNLMSLNFTFYRLGNPFTDEDYQLSRSVIYKSSWYRAVDTWRTGRVFTDN